MDKIAITTGDILGIGEELVYKALVELGLDKNKVIIIGKKLDLPYQTIELDSSDNGKFCYESLEVASNLAKKGEIKAIVTAPVSKEALFKSGYKYSGQTEILEKFLYKDKAQMLFISRDLRVMLLTRHLPLLKIKITEDMIIEKVLILKNFLLEKCKIKSPKIAILALNPHAGENGILGMEENEIIIPAIKKLNKNETFVFGPYSADGFFSKVGKKYLNFEKQEFDAIVAMYHDQALCPMKALCGTDAVNTTIGLEVIRTSPSSGTAYDIKGKNIANPDGMISAIKLALKII